MGTGCLGRSVGPNLRRPARPASKGRFLASLLLTCACVLAWPQMAGAGKPAPKPPKAQGTFTDHLTAFDSTRWTMADGWANGSPFDNAWRADHVSFVDGKLDIRLDDDGAFGQPYSSGEYRTTGYYGYGCFEAGFRPVARSGVVSSFFTFAGPYDNGGNGKHNEIDFEFLGRDTTVVQLNYWANDDAYASANEVLLNLGFDASKAFHAYAFKWTSRSIAWYVDGSLVHEVFDSAARPIPKAAESLQKIMMNVWPVDDTAAAWAGVFSYPGQPLHGLYDWVRYTAGEDCTIGPPPPSPPPPDPSATPSVHVQQIAMSTDARSTQAIARVTIVDNLGQPVSGATVSGAWSGVISGGDTSRSTDSLGTATFYSARSRSPGSVQFCVTGIAAGALLYDNTANLETCSSIVK
jgi:endo-1,3-1,4-beta-glycanase ExoK